MVRTVDSTSVMARDSAAREPATSPSVSVATFGPTGPRQPRPVTASGAAPRQMLEYVERRVGDHGAGAEDGRRAGVQQRRDIRRRDDTTDHDEDVGPTAFGERAAQLRHERQVTGGQRVDPDDVDIVVDGLLRDLVRGGEQRPDVDVEAEVGERRDDDLLPPVVAVLAHLGDQDPRPAALGPGELVGGGEHGRDRIWRGARHRRASTAVAPFDAAAAGAAPRTGTRRRSYG